MWHKGLLGVWRIVVVVEIQGLLGVWGIVMVEIQGLLIVEA